MAPGLSVVVTFHKEGLFAHAALCSYLKSRADARQAGIDVEVVLVLDNADTETTAIIRNHPDLEGDELIIEVAVGDAALARNLGLARARGIHACTLDGDDLISREYFRRHMAFAVGLPERTILHPEVVVSFGRDNFFSWQLDQDSTYFSADMLISENPWVSAVFARRDVFAEVPYVGCRPKQTGFGYEDWHWSCQSVAAGFRHVTVPETAYFYRLKQSGSVNATSSELQVVMPPSDLFGRWEDA
ncbi:glycosyltransferase [Stenotrophomonas sp. SM006]|jgi:glycosyltransferase involved in cell wall biosynthesis|uniref:glycosyltransferase n=1 Tax=Stenotrophomonas maltophilia TaxID=40324 RepID=UPI000F78DDA6|nr:glycosyltransferase [Stenotrophomonas maltophilia]MBN5087870.1 glycosyltransferase [Stenotrophomonas maltophilia]RRU89822.1 glycosyltransferase [Stenotrophomonas maltophilia]